MKGWGVVLLSDYYTISSGLSKPASEFGSGFPFLSFKDVFWNYFVPDELTELVNTTEIEKEKCSVKKGDIFLTRTSEKAEELGMSCVALKNYPEATFNGFTKRLRPKVQDAIDPVFIGFYLRSPFFRAEIIAFSNLITRASLNNGAINRLKIKVPSIDTQKRIGSILMNYNKLIENNLRRIKLLEELAQRTYEEWFVKFTINGEKLPLNEETGLPEGWEIVKVGSVLGRIKSTKKIKTTEYLNSGKIPVVDQSRDFIAGYTSDMEAIIDINKPIIIFGDHTRILKFINFPFARGADGTQIILSEENRMPQHLFYFTLIGIDLSNYHYARHFKFLKDTEIVLPDAVLAQKFEIFASKNFEQIRNIQNQNLLLKESRDILLPRLMGGVISID